MAGFEGMIDIKPGEQNPIIYAAHFRLKYKDIFSMKNFYKMLHEWLKVHDWTDNKGSDKFEDYYLEKVDPAGFKEIHIWWRPRKAQTSFYRWQMKVDFKVLYMKASEIMHKGAKLKVDKGEVEMKIMSYVELDYDRGWRDHSWLKHFFNIYIKRIFRPTLLKTKLELYRETVEFQNYMKNFLQMKEFLPILYGEQFHATEAYPTWKKG